MTSCGIICEYNPFHTGHAFQLEEVKRHFDAAVCVMSGDFVQRGESAFSNKEKRAENAVKNGADIILELPFPFSSMSAEGFARAGIEVLSKSGLCTHFAFGSECADIDLLIKTAKIVSGTGFEKNVKDVLCENPSLGYARARSKYVLESFGEKYAKVLENPNDILAVEYIRANLALPKPMTPIAIKRSTPRQSKDEKFASSSYIRKNIKDGKLNEVKAYLPYETDICDYFTDDNRFYEFLKLCLSLKTPDELKGVAEVLGGVHHAIVKNAVSKNSYEELLENLANKGTTDAKVRRMLLFCLFGVEKKYLKESVAFTRVLAMNETGQKLLSETRKNRNIIIAGKASHVKENENARRQYDLAEKARRVLYSCRERLSPKED